MAQPIDPTPLTDTDTLPWSAIVGEEFIRVGTAPCGCMIAEYGDCDPGLDAIYALDLTAPRAVLHDADRCAAGHDVAHVDAALAEFLGFTVPDGAAVVAVDRYQLADALMLRSRPAPTAPTAAFRAGMADVDALFDALMTRMNDSEYAYLVYEIRGMMHDSAAVMAHLRTVLAEVADRPSGIERKLRDRAAAGEGTDLVRQAAEVVSARERATVESLLAVAEPDPVTLEIHECAEALKHQMIHADYESLLAGVQSLMDTDPSGALTRLRAAETLLDARPSRAERRGKSTWRSESAQWNRLWEMTPGLVTVAEAAASYGVGPQGLLAAVLARVAASVGPEVRLVRSDGREGWASQGGSLNFFSNLVGKPGAGKTETMSAAECLVPVAEDYIVPEGTAEGAVKSFALMERVKNDDGSFDYVRRWISDRVLMQIDEVDGVLAEMVRQGTKLSSTWRSMWVGAIAGTTTGTADRRTKLPAHSYRLGVLAGCQPPATVSIWDEDDRGTPQRFMWLPVSRQRKSGQPMPPPLRLGYCQPPGSLLPPGYTRDDGVPATRWIHWSPAAAAHVAAEQDAAVDDDDPYGELDDDDPDDGDLSSVMGHATFLRLKLHALLAIMDGLEQPTDTHWEAAGIIMKMREACMRRTKVRALRKGAANVRKQGRSDGLRRAAARVGEADAELDAHLELSSRVIEIVSAMGGVATAPQITRQLGKRQQLQLPTCLKRMIGTDGTLRLDAASGRYYL